MTSSFLSMHLCTHILIYIARFSLKMSIEIHEKWQSKHLYGNNYKFYVTEEFHIPEGNIRKYIGCKSIFNLNFHCHMSNPPLPMFILYSYLWYNSSN